MTSDATARSNAPSSNERNVPFYERNGFKVTGTHDFPRGPRLFEMWRNPAD